MAHYALVAKRDGVDEGWRACALLVAGGVEGAARQAKAMRVGGGLAFVPHPARFRLRRATRSELALLLGFFRAMGAPSVPFGDQADADATFARRERLLRSFFLGLYIDPEAMKRRFGGAGSLPVGGSHGAAGGGTDMADDGGLGRGLGGVSSPAVSMAPALPPSAESSGSGGMGATLADALGVEGDGDLDAPLGDAAQESALAAILGSVEANDGGHGREQSFDLDIL